MNNPILEPSLGKNTLEFQPTKNNSSLENPRAYLLHDNMLLNFTNACHCLFLLPLLKKKKKRKKKLRQSTQHTTGHSSQALNKYLLIDWLDNAMLDKSTCRNKGHLMRVNAAGPPFSRQETTWIPTKHSIPDNAVTHHEKNSQYCHSLCVHAEL